MIIGQRVLATPLNDCFQYMHANVFDEILHFIIGDISKVSCGINLSEEISTGFNSTLRQVNITHYEYIQVWKGCDVGINQISLFEAKVAYSNGEQILSRDIYHLGHRFDFFRMLSYYKSVGFDVSSMMVVIIVHLFLYGKPCLSLSGLEFAIMKQTLMRGNNPLKAPMASEKGNHNCIGRHNHHATSMVLSVLYILGTKSHYFGQTILHGEAKYRATGQGFFGQHVKFAENYKMYSRSQFTKGLVLMLPLIVY
ncbi:hypothetical protein IEQ34_016835 [Dendrobium chrysotoxum]|uniref:Glycosyl transferase 48 domain-containing protein n=1 Tax=Dendrobium chrysotoxum TaxID=161865 RepID=A0AAV7GFP5_DENCH|nr:hypothetical protein IEQ34_016835 [Dendrobium chrysotoxum]